MTQKELDVFQVIEVRLGNREISAFYVPVIRREIERRPGPLVGFIHIGAMLDQMFG